MKMQCTRARTTDLVGQSALGRDRRAISDGAARGYALGRLAHRLGRPRGRRRLALRHLLQHLELAATGRPAASVLQDWAGGAHGELEVGAIAVGEELGRLVELDDVAGVEHEDAREVGAGASQLTAEIECAARQVANDHARRTQHASSTHMVRRRWATTSSVEAPN